MRLVISISLIVAGTIILYYKATANKYCADICIRKDKSYYIEPEIFLAHAEDTSNGTLAPLHLFIFVEPTEDCPSCLYEADRWFAPAETFAGLYDFTLIMNQSNQDDNQIFLDHYSISQDKTLYLPDNHPFMGYHQQFPV